MVYWKNKSNPHLCPSRHFLGIFSLLSGVSSWILDGTDKLSADLPQFMRRIRERGRLVGVTAGLARPQFWLHR